MDQNDPTAPIVQSVAQQATPAGMDWLKYLDPLTLMKLLGIGGQPPPAPPPNQPVQQSIKRAGDLKNVMVAQPPPQ